MPPILMKKMCGLSAVIVFLLWSPHASVFGEIKLKTTRVASGLAFPLFATHAPGDASRLFIVEQAGLIKILDLTTNSVLATPFLDISSQVTFGGEQGMLGLAFHPNYATNGFFYVNYTGAGGASFIDRYTVSLNPNIATTGSRLEIMTFAQPFANHNGGWIDFGQDGMLYIATGDGGSANDPFNNAQDIVSQHLGKILRIDINGTSAPGGNYAIPPDNPFVGITGDDEIWAYGLRNPWRPSFDRATGDLYIADVGQNSWEEISVQPANSPGTMPGDAGYQGGRNYGWHCMEGNHCTGFGGCACLSPSLTNPVYEYSHAVGFSLTGGYSYRGSIIPGLGGTYFFADYVLTKIWSFRWDGLNGTTLFTDHTATLSPSDNGFIIGTISSFGEDANGELYIVDHGGEIFKLIHEVLPPSNDDCPTAVLLTDGPHEISSLMATSSGITESCGNFDSDIWFLYTANCTGVLEISICDASFDTELAVYDYPCPTGPNTALACNNDSCGTGSAISVPVIPGGYIVRIGGVGGAQGTGTLNINCTVPPPCTGDVTPPGPPVGNGVVNIDDLVAILNAFGPCPDPGNCPEDITPPGPPVGNGVVNIDDLVAVLNAFGPCP